MTSTELKGMGTAAAQYASTMRLASVPGSPQPSSARQFPTSQLAVPLTWNTATALPNFAPPSRGGMVVQPDMGSVAPTLLAGSGLQSSPPQRMLQASPLTVGLAGVQNWGTHSSSSQLAFTVGLAGMQKPQPHHELTAAHSVRRSPSSPATVLRSRYQQEERAEELPAQSIDSPGRSQSQVALRRTSVEPESSYSQTSLSLQTSRSQLELNAEQKIRTMSKLQRDTEALHRKAANMSQTACERRAANQLKADRVAEQQRREVAAAKARLHKVQNEDRIRKMSVDQHQASERQRWEAAGERLEQTIQKNASQREAMIKAREGRIQRKLDEDEEKLRRKAEQLHSVSDSLHAQNTQCSQKTAEHQRRFTKQQEERRRQLAVEEAKRSSIIQQTREAERRRLLTSGSQLDEAMAEAARVRHELQQAAVKRTAQKLRKDEQKLTRKFEHLSKEQQRLHDQNRLREEKVERTKFYESLVNDARAKCGFA